MSTYQFIYSRYTIYEAFHEHRYEGTMVFLTKESQENEGTPVTVVTLDHMNSPLRPGGYALKRKPPPYVLL